MDRIGFSLLKNRTPRTSGLCDSFSYLNLLKVFECNCDALSAVSAANNAVNALKLFQAAKFAYFADLKHALDSVVMTVLVG